MKQFLITALAAFTLSTPALADQALATAKNCMACHAVDKKVVGPSFKDVAAKYAKQKDAADMLAVMVDGKRLKDISDLPLDLAV